MHNRLSAVLVAAFILVQCCKYECQGSVSQTDVLHVVIQTYLAPHPFPPSKTRARGNHRPLVEFLNPPSFSLTSTVCPTSLRIQCDAGLQGINRERIVKLDISPFSLVCCWVWMATSLYVP